MFVILNILMVIVSLVNIMGICFNDDNKKLMFIMILYFLKYKFCLFVIVKFWF